MENRAIVPYFFQYFSAISFFPIFDRGEARHVFPHFFAFGPLSLVYQPRTIASLAVPIGDKAIAQSRNW